MRCISERADSLPPALRAQLKGRYAEYDLDVANYNKTLINALSDVATQVSSIRAIDREMGDGGGVLALLLEGSAAVPLLGLGLLLGVVGVPLTVMVLPTSERRSLRITSSMKC